VGSRRGVVARAAPSALFALAAIVVASFQAGAAGNVPFPAPPKPSRKAAQACAWERFSDAQVGLAAWVQRCDYGSRKIDFVASGSSLAIRYSDGGAPDPLVDMFALRPGETPSAGVRRIFSSRTAAGIARRCVLAPYRGTQAPAGVARWTFVPNAAYRKALKAKEDPNEVGDPACGDWGDAPDGIQYFETWPKSAARRFAFVRVGQDEPLFDEDTLQPLPQAPARPR
jgi:hypothetical protein